MHRYVFILYKTVFQFFSLNNTSLVVLVSFWLTITKNYKYNDHKYVLMMVVYIYIYNHY